MQRNRLHFILLSLAALFFTCPSLVFSQSLIPDPSLFAFTEKIPSNEKELLKQLSENASAQKCTFGEQVKCVCLKIGNLAISHWSPQRSTGISYSHAGMRFYVEGYQKNTPLTLYGVAFQTHKASENWMAEVYKGGDTATLKNIKFGNIKLPTPCAKANAQIKEVASASSAIWKNKSWKSKSSKNKSSKNETEKDIKEGHIGENIVSDSRWRVNDYQRNGSLLSQSIDGIKSGFFAPTLYLSLDRQEIEQGYFFKELNGFATASVSTQDLRTGIGILSRYPFKNKNALSALTVGGQLSYDSLKLSPFVNGSVFLGSPKTHLSSSLFYEENETRSRPFSSNLFQTHVLNRVGTLLNGDQHHLRLSVKKTELNSHSPLVLSGEYHSNFHFGKSAVSLRLRHLSEEVPSNALLLSTTFSARMQHRFGHQGLYAEPTLILINNSSVLPADKGYDASTTGIILGQVNTGMHAVGSFKNFKHIVDLKLTLGRDLLGFQQRAIRDGGSKFRFQRQPDFTYFWMGIENAIRSKDWSFSFPLGLLGTMDNALLIKKTPMAGILFSSGNLHWKFESLFNEDGDSSPNFRASTGAKFSRFSLFTMPAKLKINYSFGNFDARDILNIRARDMKDSTSIITALFQPTLASTHTILHSANLQIEVKNVNIETQLYYNETLRGISGSVILGGAFGWNLDARAGWSSNFGSAFRAGFSTNL